jgi:N-acetylglucosaminyl-diphospho-decaprenol L-rhamnosyltransferase
VHETAGRARWAAVVVNYEAGPLLLECVRSVLADESAGPVELVVVDNGSSDGSVEAVEKNFPGVLVVHSPGNVGYSRAANLGIAATRAPIIAVLNADLTLDPGSAGALVPRMEHDARLGAVGPRVANVDGSDYPSARRIPSVPLAAGHAVFGLVWPANPFTTRYRQLDADPAVRRDVDWVSGSAVWLSRAALDAIGGWDERYFMYMEDLDLSWRLRRGGWRIEYEPAGRVVHVQGAMTSRHPYRMTVEHHRSAWQFCRRRFTGLRAALLPFAGIFLAFRAVMAMGEHAWRASKEAGSAR